MLDVVYAKFNDKCAGKDTIKNSGDYYAKKTQAVSIKAVSAA